MNRCEEHYRVLISGYLDGELTQGDEQRVRLHLEGCPACRAEVAAMREIREAQMTTPFRVPEDDQWREAPRGATSRTLRWAGWILLAAGLAVAAWEGGRELLASEAPWTELLPPLALVVGGALLLLSVLLDRLAAARTDRYRRIEK